MKRVPRNGPVLLLLATLFWLALIFLPLFL